MVKFEIKLNHANLARLGEAAARALPKTLDAVKSDIVSAQVVPRDLGDLEESMHIAQVKPLIFAIYWDTPYARRMFYGNFPRGGAPYYNYRTDKNPNAQARWTDHWVYGEKKEFVTQAFTHFLKEESGGIVR